MEPKDFLRKLHPNQFSDSKIKERVECSRDILDFYISNLSKQNKHFEFESFIRKLLEREVCPNLIEETGPAAGGDGKVDTENYPVAESLQNFWLNGLNLDNERWAFAISLKMKWKSKCDSDIEKIINTKRGYKKIFFVTNQSIKNDIREKYQDDKSKETGVEIIILDKSWVLDKSLKIENMDLLKIIGVEHTLKEKELGERDYKRTKRINEIEEKLKDYSSKDILNQDVVDLAYETTMLSIENEASVDEINMKFQRALRLAKKKENIIAERNILYEICLYSHWRINDETQFEEYYQKYQQAIMDDKQIDEIEKLVNLWIIAYTRNKQDKEKTKEKTDVVFELLEEKLESKSKVVYLRAKTLLCTMRITLQEDVDLQFRELIDIIKEAVKFKEYDFIQVAKTVEVFLPIYNNNEDYNKLYELITENLTEREGDIKKAEMYLKRSKAYSKEDKHYEAIKLIGKCLNLLYKEETSGKLIEAYINIGGNFEAIGLKYAAKNYYIAATSLFINLFFKENYLDPFSIKVLKELINIEIEQGNIESAIKWIGIRNILINVLIDKNEELDLQQEEEYNFERDALIAMEILKTSVNDFDNIDNIISLAQKNNLIMTVSMSKYVIGIYDEELLKECNNKKEIVDKTIKEVYESSYKQQLPYPNYINDKQYCIQSSLAGNKIKINLKKSKVLSRFAEFILALLENSFATMFSHKTFMRGDIIINLTESNRGTFGFDYSFDGIDTYNININSLDLCDITTEIQKSINNKIYELLLNILAVNFIYDDFESTVKNLFEDEKVFERAINHTSNLYNLNIIFGNEEENEIEHFGVERKSEWYQKENIKNIIEDKELMMPYDGEKEIIYDVPEDSSFDNISNSNIYSSGMIQNIHWDMAKWKGTLFLIDLEANSCAKLGFLFKNEKGAKLVFNDLIDYASSNDKDGKIILSIIKGINKDRKFDYRIMITSKTEVPKNKKNIIINSVARFHTMNCDTNENLMRLEKFIKDNPNVKISIFPAVQDLSGKITPFFDYEIRIKEIKIKNAYSVGKNDIESIAIMKDDNPLIPMGIMKCPIQELLDVKNKLNKN